MQVNSIPLRLQVTVHVLLEWIFFTTEYGIMNDTLSHPPCYFPP